MGDINISLLKELKSFLNTSVYKHFAATQLNNAT